MGKFSNCYNRHELSLEESFLYALAHDSCFCATADLGLWGESCQRAEADMSEDAMSVDGDCAPSSAIPCIMIKPHRVCVFLGIFLCALSAVLSYFACNAASAESALLSSAFGHEIKMIGGSESWSFVLPSWSLWCAAVSAMGLGIIFAAHWFYSGLWLRNDMLESRTGWPFRTEHSVPLDKIESVSLSVSLWDIPFGTGTVVVKGTGGAKIRLRMAARAQSGVHSIKNRIEKHRGLEAE